MIKIHNTIPYTKHINILGLIFNKKHTCLYIQYNTNYQITFNHKMESTLDIFIEIVYYIYFGLRMTLIHESEKLTTFIYRFYS